MLEPDPEPESDSDSDSESGSVRSRQAVFLSLVEPGCPVTFLASGCLVAVGREGLTFDVGLSGSLTSRNHRAVAAVLEAVVTCAQVVRLCVGRLEQVDHVAAAMLADAACQASRANVGWSVVDGDAISMRPYVGLSPGPVGDGRRTALRWSGDVTGRRGRRRAGVVPMS